MNCSLNIKPERGNCSSLGPRLGLLKLVQSAGIRMCARVYFVNKHKISKRFLAKYDNIVSLCIKQVLTTDSATLWSLQCSWRPTSSKRLSIKHSLDRHTCGTYTRSTVVDGLLVLCEAVLLQCHCLQFAQSASLAS